MQQSMAWIILYKRWRLTSDNNDNNWFRYSHPNYQYMNYYEIIANRVFYYYSIIYFNTVYKRMRRHQEQLCILYLPAVKLRTAMSQS